MSVENELETDREAYAIPMDSSLKVHVERHGDKFVWELHRDGLARPIKFSAPIYSSEGAARTSGNEVREDHLARLAAKKVTPGRFEFGRPISGRPPKLSSP